MGSFNSSNQVQIIDQTDTSLLMVDIKSNLPQTQVYDVNQCIYNPDWHTNNLILTPSVSVNNISIPLSATDIGIVWKRKNNDGDFIDIFDGESVVNKTLHITQNILSDDISVTYVCQVLYKGMSADQEITFQRMDTGKNGNSPIEIQICSLNGNIYINNNVSASLCAYVWQDNADITDQFPNSAFVWEKYDMNGTKDAEWSYIGKSVRISNTDVWRRAIFNCSVDISQRIQ